MNDGYEQQFELQRLLSLNPRLISSPILYNVSIGSLYAAAMDRLARPLPNGQPSPFTSQDPGTAHSALIETIIYLAELLASQLNLVPDATLIEFYRLLGAELEPAQYGVIELEFTRSPESVRAQLNNEVRLGYVVYSGDDPSLSAITTEFAAFPSSSTTVTLPARLNRIGQAPQIRIGEFSVLSAPLAGVISVRNTGKILSEGKSSETLAQAVVRVREGIRTGNLGRLASDGVIDPGADNFFGRCITVRDFEYYGRQLGAKKVNVLPRYSGSGIWSDNTTVVIYEPELAASIEPRLLEMTLEDAQVSVKPAEVIELVGSVQIKITPELTAAQAIDLARQQIRAVVNPPSGTWGDQSFASTLASAIEQVQNIYAVPSTRLITKIGRVPLAELAPTPLMLFAVDLANLEIEVLR